MALLTPPDILPEAMRFLLRALLASPEGRLPESALLALVSPEGMAEVLKSPGAEEDSEDKEDAKAGGRVIAKASLAALGQLGLVEFEGSGITRMVVPAPPVVEHFPTYDRLNASAFARFLRGRVLDGELAEAELGQGSGTADLAQALTVLHLAPDPLRPFGGFDTSDRPFQRAQRDMVGIQRPRWPVTNKEQYRSFVRWSVYLGFATPVAGGRGRTVGLVPDASVAVAEHIGELVSRTRPVNEVVSELGQLFPLFDGGRLHEQLRSEVSGAPGAGFVSPGLALTLQRLHHGKVLTLERRSDAPVLQFALGEQALPVSHVSPANGGA